jgi:hypothetical protein
MMVNTPAGTNKFVDVLSWTVEVKGAVQFNPSENSSKQQVKLSCFSQEELDSNAKSEAGSRAKHWMVHMSIKFAGYVTPSKRHE